MASIVLSLLGILFCIISVIAFYATSQDCRWQWLQRGQRIGFSLGLLAALAAFIAWSIILGFGVSLCVLLGSWGLLAIIFSSIIAVLPSKA